MRDGDDYVINGQKMWTSISSDADYCWLAVRTDPEAPKHKGISIVIVPMDTPGITLSPLRLLGEHDINATFFDDVRVPVANVVGAENMGWTLITNQLNHERVTLCSSGIIERALGDAIEWARTTNRPAIDGQGGRRVIDDDWVQLNLARVYAKLDVLRLMNWQVGVGGDAGRARHRALLGDQGVRHRVLPRGAAPAVRDPRSGRVPQGRARPGRSWRRGSRTSTAAC